MRQCRNHGWVEHCIFGKKKLYFELLSNERPASEKTLLHCSLYVAGMAVNTMVSHRSDLWGNAPFWRKARQNLAGPAEGQEKGQ
jgi:hypothetical protein